MSLNLPNLKYQSSNIHPWLIKVIYIGLIQMSCKCLLSAKSDVEFLLIVTKLLGLKNPTNMPVT